MGNPRQFSFRERQSSSPEPDRADSSAPAPPANDLGDPCEPPSRASGGGLALSRREALKVAAGAVVASQVTALRPAFAATPGTRFFTPAEYALADELAEIIIPADAHSPGARAAKVAIYIDSQLADAFEDKPRTEWREGLALVNTIAAGMHGKPLMDLTPDQRLSVVTRLAQGEPKFTTPEGKFFGELKRRVVYAYYTSNIGIHDEIQYRGNVLLQEFEGTDVSQKPGSGQ